MPHGGGQLVRSQLPVVIAVAGRESRGRECKILAETTSQLSLLLADTRSLGGGGKEMLTNALSTTSELHNCVKSPSIPMYASVLTCVYVRVRLVRYGPFFSGK